MTRRELTSADYIAMLRRRWVLITVLAVIGSPLAYIVSKYLPAKYKSETLVLVERPEVSPDLIPQLETATISERLASMKPQILSRSRLEPIIRQFGLYPEDVNQVSMDALVERLQKAIEITPVAPMEETRSNSLPGFFVNVTMSDPKVAQEVCDAVTSMFIQENLRISQQHSTVTTQFLAQQLDDAKKDLDAQDAKLAAFQRQYMGSLPDNEQTNLNLLTNLTSQLDAATQALARAQQDKSFSESLLTQQIAAWQAAQNGRNPDNLQQQLAALQTQLATLQARYTDDYPDVIKTKNDIALLQKKLAEAASEAGTSSGPTYKSPVEPTQVTQLRTQIHTYEQVISEKTKEQEKIKEQIALYQARVQSSPAIEEQYKELTRGYQTALDTYNTLLKKKDEAEQASSLQDIQAGEQFRVLDPANLPNTPSFPNRPLFAVGGFLGGLCVGVGLALLLEMKDTSFRTEQDVEFALRLPVLALVPVVEPALNKKSHKESGAMRSGPNGSLGLDART